MKISDDLILAYNDSINFARSHYENFPVISFLLPKHLRKHIAVIYKFARLADDIADEGNLTQTKRIEQLDEYEDEFLNSLNGNYSSLFWTALVNTINEFNLPIEYFQNLLKAFRQDVIKKRYKDFHEVVDYCIWSANTVGRLILELFNIRNDKIYKYSDSVCTALQLTNFYQDLSLDFQKGRIYIPEDEMKSYGVLEKDFELKQNNSSFESLIQYQVERTAKMYLEGRNLIPFLPKRLKFEIGWTILGGEKILEKIKEIDYNVWYNRPTLSRIDYMRLLIKSFRKF
jgi:squalene synthase HpnC